MAHLTEHKPLKIAIASAVLSAWLMLSGSAAADASAHAPTPKPIATVLTPRGMTIWTLEPEALNEFQPMLDINSDGKHYSASYLAAVSLQLARDDGITDRAAVRAIKELVQKGFRQDKIYAIVATAATLGRAYGHSADFALAQMIPALSRGMESIIEFDEKYNTLTAAQYKEIRYLFDQGKSNEAHSKFFDSLVTRVLSSTK